MMVLLFAHRYIRKNVTSQPGVLRLGQDVANVDTLLDHVARSRESLKATGHQLRALERTLSGYSGHPDYSSPDRITPSTDFDTVKRGLLLAYAVSVPLLAFRAYKYLVS